VAGLGKQGGGGGGWMKGGWQRRGRPHGGGAGGASGGGAGGAPSGGALFSRCEPVCGADGIRERGGRSKLRWDPLKLTPITTS
jgi:hypothetical protein